MIYDIYYTNNNTQCDNEVEILLQIGLRVVYNEKEIKETAANLRIIDDALFRLLAKCIIKGQNILILFH